MKNHTNNRIALLLLTAMLATVTTACGDSGVTVSDTGSNTVTSADETTAAPETDGLEDRDMNGFTLSILHHNDEFMTWTVTQLDAEEVNGELLNDAIYERNEAVKERFNCNFSIEGIRSVDSATVQSLVMSGDTTYDIIMQRDANISQSANLLTSWTEIPHIKLNSEWWYPEASAAFMFGDKLFAAANSISLSCVSRASGFAFNKDVYESMGMKKSLYQYVYDDEWTLDNFAMIAKAAAKDIDGDADMDENDRYGIGNSSWKEVFARLINGAGVEFITRDNTGEPVFNLDTNETAVYKLQKIYELFTDKEIYTNNSSNMDEAAAYGDILKSTALFRLCHARAMDNILRNAEYDMGFVPNPKYDENQDRYYSTTWAFEIMTLPKTLAAERYDNIGMILEALSFASHHDVLERYKEDIVKTKFSQDEDTIAMFDIAFNSMTFDLGLVLWESNIANPLIKNIYASGTGNVASSLASQKSSIEALLEKFEETLKDAE